MWLIRGMSPLSPAAVYERPYRRAIPRSCGCENLLQSRETATVHLPQTPDSYFTIIPAIVWIFRNSATKHRNDIEKIYAVLGEIDRPLSSSHSNPGGGSGGIAAKVNPGSGGLAQEAVDAVL